MGIFNFCLLVLKQLLPNLKILDLSYSKYLDKTPDFTGLPLLERLNLKACLKLEEIHPSIGYHERVVFIGMKGCSKLKRFPPIIQMKNLETLKLSECKKLEKFPVIQRRMDSLVKLCLNESGIKIIPPSVGQFCTSLEFFDLSSCSELKTIEGNFRLLKGLKYLYLNSCRKLERLADNFFDVECCLEVLFLSSKSQDSKTFKNLMNRIGSHIFHQDSSVSMKFPKFPRFIRKLDISWSNLEDGDIPSDICELLNLQELDLSRNNFSRLDSSLSRLPRLKSLNLSDCYYLEELPDLPPSISILKATECESLKSIGDLSKYKWLWKVSLWREHQLIGGEGALRSLLQGNVVEDHFMSVRLPGGPQVTNKFPYRRTYTLELPDNWHNDFSGFLICADNLDDHYYTIVIHQEMSMSVKSEPGRHWEEFDKTPKSYDYAQVGYIPFSSLQKNPWWNSAYTKITFQLEGIANPKVRLVPWKVIADSRWRGKGAIEFKDDDTFKIIGASKSLIMIIWSHGHVSNTFIQTKMQEIDGDVEPIIGQIETGPFWDERMNLFTGYKELLKKEKLAEITKRSTIKRA